MGGVYEKRRKDLYFFFFFSFPGGSNLGAFQESQGDKFPPCLAG